MGGPAVWRLMDWERGGGAGCGGAEASWDG